MANRVPYPMVPRSGPYGGHPPPHPAPYHGYPGSSYGPPQPPPQQQQHYHPHQQHQHHPHHPPPPPPQQHHHPHPGMHPQQQHHHNMVGGHHYPMVPSFNAGPPPPPPPPPMQQSQQPGAMKGSYHPHMPPYGASYGMVPYQHHHHPTMQQQQPQPYPNLTNASSDSASISSKSSINSRKKRTIDGVGSGSSGNNGNNGSSNNKNNNKSSSSSSSNIGIIPSAYTFRRTDSNSSSTSTVTAGNNTSLETNLTEDSPHRLDRSDSLLPALNMDGMIFDDQSARPSRPTSRQGHPPKPQRYHRRDYSAASTASSLSVGGFSLSSYEKAAGVNDDAIMSGTHNILNSSSPKRHKKLDKASLVVDTSSGNDTLSEQLPDLSHPMETHEHGDLQHLSIDHKEEPPSTSSESSSGTNSNLFLSLSTSPINAQPDVDATPISKNTAKQRDEVLMKLEQSSIFKKLSTDKCRPSETPTPPVHGELGDSEMLNDDHSTLDRHLRGQSFTPLPHAANCGDGSPSHQEFASAIAPQLSWSIAGETPSMDDLDEWDEEHTKLKTEQKTRPGSTTSTETRNMTISPHDFQMWKEEHELADRALSGTTTPLPVFFEQPMRGEGSENQHMLRRHMDDQVHPMYSGSNSNAHGLMSSSNKHSAEHHHPFWSKHTTTMGMPPTPMFASTDYRDDAFGGRSPMHMDRRDNNSMEYMPSYTHHHTGHHGSNDRIRNLRGRVPPGAHLPPMPLHIPPHMSTHLPMTSPMGLGPKAGMWSPHHGGMGHSMGGSPHHNMGSPLNSIPQSKRKCVPLKPPIPSKFQGDMDKLKNVPVPEFTSLVNFPSHMSQKQSVNLPEGMRCCVMCGSACPCSTGNKAGKKCSSSGKTSGTSKGSEGGSCGGSLAPRNSNGQDQIGDKNCGYAIIPTQNKGLCTLCDVNVWVVVTSGLEIKWCKGCKNFRPWAAFGDKGLATKCLRCRERQREKYALQKEEKEKTRVVGPTSTKAQK